MIFAAWPTFQRHGSVREQVELFLVGIGEPVGQTQSLTPANQIVRDSNVDQILIKEKRVKGAQSVGKGSENNNSSINTSPVLGTTDRVKTRQEENHGLHRQGKVSKSVPPSRSKSGNSPSSGVAVVGSSLVRDVDTAVDKATSPPQGKIMVRRKSLDHPIGQQTKYKLRMIREDIEGRKPPSATYSGPSKVGKLDAIQGAKQYLALETPRETPMASSPLTSVVSNERDNEVNIYTQEPEIFSTQLHIASGAQVEDTRQRGEQKSSKRVNIVGELDDFPPHRSEDKESEGLPPHLQQMRNRIKKIKRGGLSKPVHKAPEKPVPKSNPTLNLSGLKMVKDFDPRRVPLDD